MARNPKLFIKGTLIEVSSRIQEGLPFVPNELTVLVLASILARAQTQYPVRIVSYCFMQNHFHILLIVQNPEDVPNFICYLKRESAHIINRFLGRRQHSVWCEGFDNPINCIFLVPGYFFCVFFWYRVTFFIFLENKIK